MTTANTTNTAAPKVALHPNCSAWQDCLQHAFEEAAVGIGKLGICRLRVRRGKGDDIQSRKGGRETHPCNGLETLPRASPKAERFRSGDPARARRKHSTR